MAKNKNFKLSLFGREIGVNIARKHRNEPITGNGVLNLDSHNRALIQEIFGSNVDPATSKEKYISKGYASNVDIYSIIKKIVQPASNLTYGVRRKKKNGEYEVINDTSLHALMLNPNQFKGYTWQQYIENALTFLLATGDTYTHGTRSIGFGNMITSIDVLPSQWTKITTRQNFLDPITGYSMEFDNIKQSFEKDEILHTRYANPNYTTIQDMVYGLSPIEVAKMVVEVGLDRWEADASLLHNKGAIGLLTNRSDLGMTTTQGEELQNEWNRTTGGAKNFGKVKVTNKNVDFVQLAMSSTDLQLLEKDVVTLRAACNVYGVPSVLLNDQKSSTYNNLKEANKTLYTGAIIPNVDLFLADFNKGVTRSHFPKDQTVELFVDYSDIESLQEDIHEKTKTYSTLIQDGVQSPQQAATALNIEQPDGNANRQMRSNQKDAVN